MIDHELEEMFARTKPQWRLFRRLMPFVRPYWFRAIFPLAIELVFVFFWSLSPQFLRIAIDDFITPSFSASTVPRWVWMGMGSLVGLMLITAVIQAGISIVQRTWVRMVTQQMLNDLRKWLFAHVQELSMDFFDREKQGRIIARIDRDVEVLGNMLVEVPLIMVHGIATALIAVFWLIQADWRFLIIVAAMVPAAYGAVWASLHWGLPAYRRVRRSVSRLTANLAENVTGIQVVQAFAREEENLEAYRELLDEYKENIMTGALVRGVTWPAMMLLFGLANAVVIAYAGWALPRGHVTIGEVPAAIMYLGMILGSVSFFTSLYDQLLSASATTERIIALMDRKPSVVDAPGARDVPDISGAVEFQNVFFKYDNRDDAQWVLNDISLKAEPGQVIALVGPTGAGKTSITNLIARFYEPQLGSVLIDGQDIRNVTLRSLRKRMSIVLQENFLFNGSVMDNIRFGRPDATDDEVIEAAQAMGVHDMIMNLSDGYQTNVRERGAAISHGERQLICFTRALVANPRILILDEATSAVDTNIEMTIRRALVKLMAGRTTFVVAHRLSTVRHASTIVVINDGRIAEQGTHDELLAREGMYKDLFKRFVAQV